MTIKPIVTEKAVMLIESQNTLEFEVPKEQTKPEIRRELESLLKIKIGKMKTLVQGNKKYVYAKLKKEFPAMDVATKLGLI